MRKTAVLATLALLLAAAPAASAFSGLGESEGRGIFWAGLFTLDLTDLNAQLETRGFAPLEGAFTLYGGGGYGAWESWRVGGFGGGGTRAAKNGDKRSELNMGIGIGEFKRVWPMGSVQLEVGALVGGGGATLLLSDGAPSSIDDALGSRYDTSVDRIFVLGGPSVGVRIDLTDHFGLRFSAGYVRSAGLWVHRNNDKPLTGFPSFDGSLIMVGFTYGGNGWPR